MAFYFTYLPSFPSWKFPFMSIKYKYIIHKKLVSLLFGCWVTWILILIGNYNSLKKHISNRLRTELYNLV